MNGENGENAKARVTVPETETLLQLSHTGLLCVRTKRLACSGILWSHA